MANKKDLSSAQWTNFWKSFDIQIQKRKRFLRDYNPQRSDYASLKRIGVDGDLIERIHRLLSDYDDLLFHQFCLFYKRDPQTVQIWVNASSPSEAFERLYNVFQRNSINELKKRFGELFFWYYFFWRF